MEQAAADTCNGNFGLRYGQQYEPGQLGLLGYVALASPTVGAAFENISGLFHHHQQRSILRVVRQPELSRIEYQILDRSIAARRQDAELSLGMFFNILRHALGSRWSPEAVLFEHARPESWPEHERSFGAPALFAQPLQRHRAADAAAGRAHARRRRPSAGAAAAQPGPAGAGGHAGRIAGRARRRRHPPPAGRRRAFARRCGAGAEHPELDAAAAPAQPRLHLSGVAAGGAPRAGAQLSEGSRDPDFRTGFPARLFRDQRVFRAFTAGWACRPASGGAATWRRAERHSSSGASGGGPDAQVRRRAQSRFHKTIQGKHHGSRAQHGRRGFVAPIAEVAADHGRRLLPRRYRGRPQARHPRQAGRTGAGRGQPDALRLRPAARAADPGPYRQRWRRQLRAGLS